MKDLTEATMVDGHLGEIYVMRPGQPVPEPLITCVNVGGKVRYVDARGRQITLGPRDRSHSQAVMEDAEPEKQESLRAALLADRWVHVVARG